MECNKEEAIRAKEIAEKKMQIKDFVGAKKVALKAQQLFSDLDNISQMLTVCEVHCRAGVKINGEMDWYGVLQLEQTADESSIKKQYRKLALLLHPDKNKFSGAEAAFKLIGEANMILSDRAKRSVYDIKRRATITTTASKQPAQYPNMTTFARKQPGVQHNFTTTATSHFGNVNQRQSFGSQTFWTMCPTCCVKFQYFRHLLKKSVRCNRCLQPFVATELNEPSVQSVPRPWESSNFHSHTQNSKQEVPVQGSNFVNFSCHMGFQENVAGGSSSGVNMACGDKNEDGNTVKPEKINTAKRGRKNHSVKPSAQNSRKKKGRKMSMESSDSESSTDLECETAEDNVHVEEQNTGTSNGRYPRRSSRAKRKVTYNERHIADDDDDFVSPPKRLKKVGVTGGNHISANDEQRKDTSEENLANGGESVKKYKVHETEQEPNVNSGPVASSNVRSFSSPDSEFYDFEQERNPGKFAADQIWAVYDDLNAMPRFYARIRRVFTPFKLRFTWLEYVPLRERESEWYSQELPVACGKYRHGKLETTVNVQMFSHQVSWNRSRGINRNTYDIYPNKGEIWALFKGWDAGWISDENSHRLFEYEVVEVLSDLSDGNDFRVVNLVKVQGSVSLFMRSGVKEHNRILPSEVLRFSHRVPSYRLSGSEREGVPEGSFELDTASLPNNFGEIFPSVSPDTASVKAKNMKLNEENDMETTGSKCISPDGINGDSHNEDNSVPPDEYVEPEFHDFHEDKTIDKFQSGQIWAVYSDIDQYPKFYVMIKKVVDDDITASWVEPSPQRKDEEKWIEKSLPATCGRFKVERATNETFDTGHFSHMVQAEAWKKGKYDIYPRTGQVWALYKDWNINWSEEDFSKCEYYVVETLGVAGSMVKVLLLTKVADYNVVFMPEKKGGVEQIMEIPISEILRFSHQIPAFQLTDEVDGSLHGCWELDSASVPKPYLN